MNSFNNDLLIFFETVMSYSISSIIQQKATSAISAFDLSFVKTHLTNERSLLVSQTLQMKNKHEILNSKNRKKTK